MSTVLFVDKTKKSNLAAVPEVAIPTLNKLVAELKTVDLPVSLIFDDLNSLTNASFLREILAEKALEAAPAIKQLGLARQKAYSMLEIPDASLVVRAASAVDKFMYSSIVEPRPTLENLDFNEETQEFFRGEKLEDWYRKQYETYATTPLQIQAVEDAEKLFAMMNDFRQKYPSLKLVDQSYGLITYDTFGNLTLNKIKIKEL